MLFVLLGLIFLAISVIMISSKMKSAKFAYGQIKANLIVGTGLQDGPCKTEK